MQANPEPQQIKEDDPDFVKALGILQAFMTKHIAVASGRGDKTVSFRLHYVPAFTAWWFGDGGYYTICEEWWFLNQARPNADKDGRRAFSDAIARKTAEHFKQTLGYESRIFDCDGLIKNWFVNVTFYLTRDEEGTKTVVVHI